MVALVIIVALCAVGALVYVAQWALKQGSATSPAVDPVRHPAPKAKKK